MLPQGFGFGATVTSNMHRSHDFEYFRVRWLPRYGSIVERRPAAVVVPQSADGRVWMLRVRRPPTSTSSWELPGGEVGPDETPLSAGLRELEEESGLVSRGRARALPVVYQAVPGMGPMPHHVVLARDVEPIARRPAPQRAEGIEQVRAMTREQVNRLVRTGRITVFATLSALAVTGWLGGD